MFRECIDLVSIASCRHFRGWRYGNYGNNLYEDYIVGRFKGLETTLLRSIFTRRIFGTRGTTMGNILGISLSKEYSPWIFPWNWSSIYAISPSYTSSTNPDIVCHTAPDGILASHINREFSWCESALNSISMTGYRPEKYGYISVLRLVRADLETSHLVLDGNHRLSALAALNAKEVRVKVLGQVSHNNFRFWPGVLTGRFRHDDAMNIFGRYFMPENPLIQELEPNAMLVRDEELATSLS